MGTLRINGTIDINQFWPKGTSDADTTKIKLLVNQNSFEFKKDGGSFKTTNVFFGAKSKGQTTKDAVTTSKKDGSQTVTIRLQGIDAPELHYAAAPLAKNTVTDAVRKNFNSLNPDRRQAFGESATAALAAHLQPHANNNGLMNCTFESLVDHPFEVMDTYGRFVGNIHVGGNDINIWLAENGWALPTFYTSMTADEINLFLKAWKKGKNKAGRTSGNISKDAGVFDWSMLFVTPKSVINFKIGDDKGKSLMPKVFRRQVSWMVQKKAKIIPQSTGFLAFLKKKPDQVILLNDFLANGIHSSTVMNLHDFVTAQNKITKSAEELVFKEKAGTLVDANGKQITSW